MPRTPRRDASSGAVPSRPSAPPDSASSAAESERGEGAAPRDAAGSAPPAASGAASRAALGARLLGIVERLGNLLPHPVTLFALFALGTIVLGAAAAALGVAVEDPRPPGAPGRSEDGIIAARSLMNGEGARWIVENLVRNFVGFAPLGTVLVALLGVGVAERSGLLSAAVRLVVLGAPRTMVTASLVLAGVLSNTASEMGYVVLVPMGAAIFHALGRHPLAGLAATFAGVSGGYSANLLLGTIDPLLAGITEEAARLYDPTYEVHAAVNWYFMVVSTFFITIVGTAVTALVVEPRLGRFDGARAEEGIERTITVDPLAAQERRGLRRAAVAALLVSLGFLWIAGPRPSVELEVARGTALAEAREWDAERRAAAAIEGAALAGAASEAGALRRVTVVLVLPRQEGAAGRINAALDLLPGYGVLRNPETGDLLHSPFTRGIVALLLVFFIVPGIVYGRAVGTIKDDRDVITAMSSTIGSMGLYIVLVFFAAQFVAFFDQTRLGSIVAVVGSDAIIALRLDNALVFLPFILLCAFINLMLGSASAQWAVMAPIFVPMLMRVGYAPEVIQAAYRIGDSSTNIVTPMMSYFGIVYAFACRYDRRLGIGTMISTMLPYSIAFLAGWIVLFYLWVFVLGLPVGPGAATLLLPPL
ncbi:MAG TPA: AbgT family transporter [Phycisphaerales bacterium]|nr:AbgT family transporter [Phycisphaerales bacterium]HMP36997.1 AbgT family transporter [Phycisphaerales bacterium]